MHVPRVESGMTRMSWLVSLLVTVGESFDCMQGERSRRWSVVMKGEDFLFPKKSSYAMHFLEGE